MRNVTFDPETDLPQEALAKWRKAVAAGEQARAAILDAKLGGTAINWRTDIWTTFKQLMLAHGYYQKCGYCEDRSTSSPLDADHWRPKGKVTVVDLDGVTVPVDHPGYFWLAHCWENIVPSCKRCNSEGKQTQFPILGTRCSSHDGNPQPAALDAQEQPLILHPLSKKYPPEEHVGFDELGGVFPIGNSRLGLYSILVYGLDRIDGVRREEQCNAKEAVKSALRKKRKHGVPLEQSLANRIGPAAPYSRSLQAYVAFKLIEETDKFERRQKKLHAKLAETEREYERLTSSD